MSCPGGRKFSLSIATTFCRRRPVYGPKITNIIIEMDGEYNSIVFIGSVVVGLCMNFSTISSPLHMINPFKTQSPFVCPSARGMSVSSVSV